MKQALTSLTMLATIVLGLLAGELRAVTILGFDPPSLPATANFASVPNGYGGLDWNNFYYINETYLAGSGYDNGTTSAPNAAFNGFGTAATITDPNAAELFNFASAQLTAAWIAGLQIQVDGYNTHISAVVPQHTTIVTVNPTGPTLFDFSTLDGGFNLLNKLTFTAIVPGGGGNPNPAGTEFVMDDFRFTTTIVPEPSSFVLAGLGVFGVVGYMLRRRAA